MPSVPALECDEFREVVRVGAGHAPGREAQPERQYRLLGDRAHQVEVAEVHHMGAGEAGGGHRAEQLGQPGTSFGVRGPGHDGLDEFHRGMLDEMAREPSVGVDGEVRALFEGARSGDAGGLEGGPADQGGVAVVQAQEGGGTEQDVLDEDAVDGPATEDVVVEAVADDPAVDTFPRGERGAESVEVAYGGEVDAGGHVQAPDGVAVAVHQARHQSAAAQIHGLGARSAPVPYVRRITHGGDQAVVYGDRGGVRPFRIQGADVGAGDDEVGGGHGEVSSCGGGGGRLGRGQSPDAAGGSAAKFA